MTHDHYLTISSRPAFLSVLAALNASVISFFVLWSMADAAAVNRAEEHGFDPSQLLPYDIPYDEDLGEYEIADGLSEKDKIAFPTDELKEGMSVTEGTADQTTAAMWDDSEDDESIDDSAYTESDGSEPEMIEDGAVDSDMMDATDDISSGDDLVPMEGAPTE